MRVNSLARFVLRVLAWLPLTFAVWYLAAPLLAWPVAIIAEIVTRTAFGVLVRSVEQHGALLTFVTSLEIPQGMAKTGGRAVLSVDSNVLLFSFGFPLLAALILAADEPRRVRNVLLGYAILLPFQSFGVVADFLKNVTILAGPALASQTNFTAFQREIVAFSYQFGTLILPTVVPAITWVLMHRRFLERFAGRET
jgi:hypothetical protein